MPQTTEFEQLTISSPQRGSAQARVCPERGSIVTRFQVGGENLLYLDPFSFADLSRNVRGGIPVLFPNAGPTSPNGQFPDLPQHGFARALPWQLRSQSDSSVVTELLPSSATAKMYPYDFRLIQEIDLYGDTLNHNLMIQNRGNVDMPIAPGIHPYLLIPDHCKPQMRLNLEGFDAGQIDWTAEYGQAFSNPGRVEISTPTRTVTIDAGPQTATQFYVWILPNRSFVCLEPWTRPAGALDRAETSLWLKPFQFLHMRTAISLASGYHQPIPGIRV